MVTICYIRIMGKRLTNRLKENRWLLLILLSAGAIRLIYLTQYFSMPEWEQLTVDNLMHHNWAQVLSGGNIIGDTTYFRAPLYIWCLGLLYFLFGISLWVGRLFGLVIGLGSILLTYMLGRRLFDSKTGLVAASIHAIYPAMLYFESELLLDPLFTLLFQIALYRIILWIESTTQRNLLWVGITIGLAAICRPTVLVLIPILLFLIVRQRAGKELLIRSGLTFLVGLTLIIGPIFLRNIVVAGDPVLIASQGGINFYIGNNEISDGISATMPPPYGYNWKLADVTYDAETAIGKSLKPGEVSTYWYNQGMNWVVQNPVRFTELFFAKLYYHIGNREISNNRSLPRFFEQMPLLRFNPLSFGLIFSLALTGMVLSWRRRTTVKVTVISMLLICAVGALFFFSSRFRMPLIPFYIIFASVGCLSLINLVRFSPRKAVVFILLTGIAAAASFYPIIPYKQSAQVISMLSETRKLYAQGRYEEAVSNGRKALRADESFPDIHLNLGAAFFRMGMADSARFHFERELQNHPGRVDAYTNQGSLYLVSGKPSRAAAVASQALSLRPYDLRANLLLVRGLAADNSIVPKTLLAAIERGAEALRDDLTFLNEAGAILVERKLYEQAHAILTRALESKPPPIETDDQTRQSDFTHLPARRKQQKAITYYHLGLIAGLNRQYDVAIDNNLKAIERDPDMVEAYINLAAGYLSSGNKWSADSLLAVAAARFPGNLLISQIKSSLE